MSDHEMLVEAAENRFPGMGWKIIVGTDGNPYVCSAATDRADAWDHAAASAVASEVACVLASALSHRRTAHVAVETSGDWAVATSSVVFHDWQTLPFAIDDADTQ